MIKKIRVNITYLLLFIMIFIAVAGIFTASASYDTNKIDTMQTQPIFFTDAVQVRVGLQESSTNFRLDEKVKEFINWKLFDVWLLRQISMNIFYVFFNCCLFVFFMMIPFFLRSIIWKQSKDGKKRSLLSI